MKQILGAIFLLAIFACGNNSTESVNQTESVVNEQTQSKTLTANEELLKKEASRLRAGGSVKSAELIGKKAIIKYVENYQEYKKLNPQSRVTEKDLEGYWSTGKAIKKALNDGSVRLMKKLDFIEETEINLPINGKTYKINVAKKDLEDFLGKSFEDVKNDWAKSFSDEYVYSDLGREKFFKKFGKIN